MPDRQRAVPPSDPPVSDIPSSASLVLAVYGTFGRSSGGFRRLCTGLLSVLYGFVLRMLPAVPNPVLRSSRYSAGVKYHRGLPDSFCLCCSDTATSSKPCCSPETAPVSALELGGGVFFGPDTELAVGVSEVGIHGADRYGRCSAILAAVAELESSSRTSVYRG